MPERAGGINRAPRTWTQRGLADIKYCSRAAVPVAHRVVARTMVGTIANVWRALIKR